MNAPLVGKIVIVGVGLMGGSLGMAWRRAGAAGEVVGLGRSEAKLRKAVQLGAIDRGTIDQAAAVEGAEVVVLCTPVGAFPAILKDIYFSLKPGAVVTDVGSVKGPVRELARDLPPGVTFIGGHPMAGKESTGVEAAAPDLFRGARYVLTPCARGEPEGGRGADAEQAALSTMEALARATGATPVIMSPEDHDRAAAAVSHLPQILAVALVEAAAGADSRFPGMLDLAAGGFRDTTRIASSDPLMWRDILLENGPAVLEMSAVFREGLRRLEEAIRRRDAGQIEVCLRRAKEIRDAWLRSRWENEKAGR